MNSNLIALLLGLCLVGGVIAAVDENTNGDDSLVEESDSIKQVNETPEQETTREAELERIRLENLAYYERFEKAGEERVKKQREIDDAWLEKYNRALHDAIDPRDPEEFSYVLKDIYFSYGVTSNTKYLRYRLQDVLNLMRLAYMFAIKDCNNDDFQSNDVRIQKYSKGFSSSVVNYVRDQHSKYLQTCRKIFQDMVKPADASGKTVESEAFTLLDHVLPADPWPTSEPWLMKEKYSVVPGIANYARERIGKKAHKDGQLELFFSETIKPVCDSVVKKFDGQKDIVELMKSQEEVRRGLDEGSIKWLTSLRVCEIIRSDLDFVKYKSHLILQQQRQATKKGKCFGCFGSNGN